MGNQIVAFSTFIPSFLILIIGGLLTSMKHHGVRLVGVIVLSIGLYLTLASFYAITGLAAMTIGLIVLLIGLLSLLGAKSLFIKIFVVVVAIFVILTLLQIFGSYPPDSFWGRLFSLFGKGWNDFVSEIFKR